MTLQIIIEYEDICIHVNAQQRAMLEEAVFSKQVDRQCDPSMCISQSLSPTTLTLTQ